MLARLDLRLLRLLRTRGHAPAIEHVVLLYSRVGEHARLWYAIAALGAIVDRRRRPTYLRAGRTVLTAQLLNAATKVAIRRARPLLEDLPALSPTVSGLSHPSAHATTSFAAAGTLCEAMPPAPLYAAATAMALTRPYLGVHYPSDVVVGALLGAVLARTGA